MTKLIALRKTTKLSDEVKILIARIRFFKVPKPIAIVYTLCVLDTSSAQKRQCEHNAIN
jgi:hypothetical protein